MNSNPELISRISKLYDLISQEPDCKENIEDKVRALFATPLPTNAQVGNNADNLFYNLVKKVLRQLHSSFDENNYAKERQHLLFELESILEHIEPLEISILRNIESILNLLDQNDTYSIPDHMARIIRLVNELHSRDAKHLQKKAKELKDIWKSTHSQNEEQMNLFADKIDQFHTLMINYINDHKAPAQTPVQPPKKEAA